MNIHLFTCLALKYGAEWALQMMLWIIGSCEVKHFEIKILRLRKYITFIVINNMKCIKHFIMSMFCGGTAGGLLV